MNIYKLFRRVILLIYLLTAIFSSGYHHPDEHYQIIEFAGLKGGWNNGADLCWEYDAQIRPTLQPMLALAVFKVLGVFGVHDPFALSMALRLLTALFALWCMRVFFNHVVEEVGDKYHKVFVLLSCLLWFLPAVCVRFSSETWAGLMMLLSVAGLYVQCPRTKFFYALIGILWGFSFEFRYQMAFAAAGIFLYLAIIRREHWKDLLTIVAGGLGTVAVCTALDSWFYGDWVFAPLNYFKINVLEDVASHFGVEPWTFYFAQIYHRPTPLIGVLIAASLLFFTVRNYRNVLVWCIIPFLLAHSLVAHKELRFLFPMVFYLPFILMWTYQQTAAKLNMQIRRAVVYPILIIALIINTVGLTMMMFKPAGDGNIAMLQYLKRRHPQAKLYTIAWSNPYSLGDIKGLTPRFYANPNIQLANLDDVLDGKVALQNDDLVMLLANYHEKKYLENRGFSEEKRSIPRWIENLDRFYQVYPKKEFIFALYSKKSE